MEYKYTPCNYFKDYFDTSWYYEKCDASWNNYYKIEDDKAWAYKGEDNLITVKILDGKETDYARAIKASFPVGAPKFNTGDKVKFSADGSTNWKQGVIYSLNKKVTISKTNGDKEFKADKLQWFYTIIESGNLKTWDGIKENVIRVDDTPDYNKYFDLMSRCGMDFKRDQYTIISWNQYETTESTYSYGHRGYVTEVALKPKINDKVTKISFWVNSGGKLPPIGEKC